VIRSLFAIVVLACAVQVYAQFPTEADLRGDMPPGGGIWVDSLDVIAKIHQEWGKPNLGHSVGNGPISLHGVKYKHGIGTHASSDLLIDLKGDATRFAAVVGVDDEKKGFGSVRFHVIVDDEEKARTPILHGGDEPKFLSVDLTGARHLRLSIDDADDGIEHDHADWAGATIILKAGAAEKPRAIDLPVPPLPVVGGPAAHEPGIHGPKIVGTTPGRPFIFLIPATGDGPLTFSAANLPAGLALDARTGIITGSLQSAGTTDVKLSVKGTAGTATSTLVIVGGDHKLALTPPMGWNSWNVWADHVDAEKVRAAADAMVASGLAAHGFQYVNIDDTWEGKRDASGEITVNEKFKDMKALADYVHSKGLKLGIYSSPGETTCAGFPASYGHEEQDAKTFGKWGVDYLKYDWCSYGKHARNGSLGELQKPYVVMRKALDTSSRDIVYSLCQYGDGDVWKWGQEVGGNCWRTTGDIQDTWSSMANIGFGQNGHEVFAGPGHWNDPDMLVVGKVGWGNVHPSRLTPDEQVTHITLWSLLSAPLLVGCDMSQLDPFTTALLTNDEVLAIDQDPLGKPAGRRSKEYEVWSRPLADGTIAVGLFNRKSTPADVVADWADIGAKGEQPVRDLWQQKDLGNFTDSFKIKVPRHGAVLIKVGKPKS
jgi:alpha-galactosidase